MVHSAGKMRNRPMRARAGAMKAPAPALPRPATSAGRRRRRPRGGCVEAVARLTGAPRSVRDVLVADDAADRAAVVGERLLDVGPGDDGSGGLLPREGDLGVGGEAGAVRGD